MKNILVTGGAGFIGNHLVKLLVKKYPEYTIVNLDALTYAGNLASLASVQNESNYSFVKADICNAEQLHAVFSQYEITDVIHLAAESHVDRSISSPDVFIKTNVLGTTNLLNAARSYWADDMRKHLFYHVSTDEVFGSLGDEGFFTEETAYDPKSPYSASKASSDHLVRAYGHTYGMPFIISNCSNNYGSFQFPEKLIPVVIDHIKEKQPIPIYGTGENVRDWLWVEDHVSAIDLIFHKGNRNETYCIGGQNEWSNLELVKLLIAITDKELGREEGSSLDLISFVKDRAGHDFRYAIDSSKLTRELDWNPSVLTEEGMEATVKWYLNNQEWLDAVKSGEYRTFYESQYVKR
ncbi:MAG: dTDP-glucose 4,6-dehydratase [Flavobacteriales bacterium]